MICVGSADPRPAEPFGRLGYERLEPVVSGVEPNVSCAIRLASLEFMPVIDSPIGGVVTP